MLYGIVRVGIFPPSALPLSMEKPIGYSGESVSAETSELQSHAIVFK